jgi:hypothetical protein
MVKWLKENWGTALLIVTAVVSAADFMAALRMGRTPANIATWPSLGAGAGSVATLLFRWLNNRTVVTRTVSQGLDAETLRNMEAIFTVAASQDVTPDMTADLSNMAAALVVGHANRVKTERLAGRVEVLPAKELTAFPAEFAAMTAAIREAATQVKGKKS